MATSNQVQQLYITYFGRPADPSGLAYWTADEETPLSVIAEGFATTPEFTADITGRTLEQIVNSFYVDLFGRNADPEGLAFWVNQIQIGNTTIEQAGVNIGDAALTADARGNVDNVALVSKIAASNQWTTTVAATTEATLAYTGTEGVNAGVNFLLPVLTTATIPTEAATQAQVDTLVQENGSGAGNTLELSVFADVATDTGTVRLDSNGSIQESSAFRFTAGNQTVNGTATTFSGAVNLPDRLVDGFTTDQDVLNITGLTTAAGALGTAPNGNAVVTNIENINLTFASANGGTSTLAMTGAQTITAAGSIANGGALGLNISNTGANSFTSTLTGNATSAFTFVNGNTATSVTTSDVADNITTGTANDTIVSAAGNDTINSGAGNDSIVSGDGGDNVTAAAGNDTIDGGAGNDTINGGAGADVMDGGAGNNQFIFNTGDVAQGETVAFSGTNDTFVVQTATDFSLMNAGGSLNGLNTLDLTAATGTAGPEATFVSAQLTGATVAVTTTAAGDSIQVDASNANAANTINLSAITFSTAGGADINGGAAADTITVTANGLDTVDAGAGNDTIAGNAAVNTLNGDDGQDTITGGGGADTITGGAGADRLTSGGAASVTFVYNSTAANFVGANADTITDFAQGAGGDALQLSAAAFTGLGVGQVSVFAAIGALADNATNIIVDTLANIQTVGSNAAGAGVLAFTNNRLAYDTTNNQWIYDNDGDFSAGSVVFANSTLALTQAGLAAANISIVA